jgi:cell division septation protein DedD
VAESTQPAPKDLFPKQTTPAQAPAGREAKAGGAKPALAAKPAPPTEAGGYAVQVGATFKDKSQAQKVVKDLAAKGYKAVMRKTADGVGYFVTTGPCPQSKAYTLQEQMKIQGVSDTKVIKF